METIAPIAMVRTSLKSFLGNRTSDTFVYQLQGRLGNQIWGLSDAFLLHKLSGKSVILDLNHCDIDDENRSFYTYVTGLPWLEAVRLKFVSNQIQHEIVPLRNDHFADPEQVIGVRGFSAKYTLLKESGLFAEAMLPTFIVPQKQKPKTPEFISLGVRRGDYWQNPHLGVLPTAYYIKAIKFIDSMTYELPLVVFGDSQTLDLQRALPRKIRHRVIQEVEYRSPISDLERLANANYSIIANSTFSFLGAYFSKAKKIFTPVPFYLAVDGWNDSLDNPRTIEIDYLQSPKLRYINLVLQKKLRSF